MLKVIVRPVYLLLLLATSAFAADKPNILILLADDLGYNDSAIYQDVFQQSPVMSMPALEALAHDGVRFTRFYTESTCSASRVALLTGRYPARQGFMPVGRGISPDVITLAEYLRQQGYSTHHVGKWHVGEVNRESFPLRQGFDSSFGFLSQWMLRGPDENGGIQLKPPTYDNPWLFDANHPKESYDLHRFQGHLEDILTQRTTRLITHPVNRKQPWFIYHAFFAPHTPLEPAERFSRLFPDTPEGKHKAMLAQLDDNLQKIIAALRNSGQWENTIIVFASDNGSPEKYGNSNAPFAGGKAEYEEGGIRTPLLVKWAGAMNKQQTRSDVVSILDIYPSLVSGISGDDITVDNFDGVASLLPGNIQDRDRSLYFLTFGGLSVLSADGQSRLSKQWEDSDFSATQWLVYSKNSIPYQKPVGFFESLLGNQSKREKKTFDDFLSWRNTIRKAPVSFESVDGGVGKITGSDFLRAPVNPSYALAFSFTAKTITQHQTLIYQKNILDISLQRDVLLVSVHGITLRVEGIQAGQCYSVVLSGEFYDRYSALRDEIRPSRVHLIINGKERVVAQGVVASFADLDLAEPTFVGMHTAQKNFFEGSISQPEFFVTQLLPGDKPIPSGIEQALVGMCR